MSRTAAWRDWYRAQFQLAWRSKSGEAFEDFVTSVMKRADSSYVNPRAAGRDGDRGCDGLGDQGKTWYACYGQRSKLDTQKKLAQKLQSDYDKMLQHQQGVSTWRFVTNADLGPGPILDVVASLSGNNDGQTSRINVEVWTGDDLWRHLRRRLDEEDWADVFPGCPELADLRLTDLEPLLRTLEKDALTNPVQAPAVRSVPVDKLERNKIHPVRDFEMQRGITFAGVIDSWYKQQSKPEAADIAAESFRAKYKEAREATDESYEIIGRLYVALNGLGYEHDVRKATAAWAVTAYFFERCDIFEHPDDLEAP